MQFVFIYFFLSRGNSDYSQCISVFGFAGDVIGLINNNYAGRYDNTYYIISTLAVVGTRRRILNDIPAKYAWFLSANSRRKRPETRYRGGRAAELSFGSENWSNKIQIVVGTFNFSFKSHKRSQSLPMRSHLTPPIDTRPINGVCSIAAVIIICTTDFFFFFLSKVPAY